MYDAIELGKKDGTIRTEINTLMTALYLIESTIAIMKLSETMEKNNQDFIIHSLDLMEHSLKK